MKAWRFLFTVTLLAFLLQGHAHPVTADYGSPSAGTTYYVSSSTGSDGNNGLSENAPFATISRVNNLNLQSGDRVLFRCGDVWRADPLTITHSGSPGLPISFSTYPQSCIDQPVLSGAQPVAGWSFFNGNIYTADLSAGQNAGKFVLGVNQVFRGSQRLVLGRWPNLDAVDGGYSTIDGQPSGAKITDNELPAGDWSGAVVHIRGMRWYILNRQVNQSSGTTMTLGASAGCWGSCTGWGYFINGHLNTLDREGEWYYDPANQHLYLYTLSGIPTDGQIEASVILKNDDRAWGGVNLGKDLQGSGIAYVTVDNLDLRRWFRNGITSPTNLAGTENHDLTIQNNHIHDVDSIGINLMTWVYSAQDGRPDGWRGGYNLSILGNTVDTANRMGINTYSRSSTLSGNNIRDIGLIQNLGAAGMGCAFDQGEGQCTEDGDGIRIKSDRPADSGNNNLVTANRLEQIAYNGIDIFGYSNTFQHNAIHKACFSKGDCGGVRTFGSSSLAQTPVHDLVFQDNFIVDTIGNTDGCSASYRTLFGFGFYIDNYSRDIQISENTVISSTVHGILYQNSTGRASGNTLYNNGWAADWSGQVWLTAAPTSLAEHSGNILFSLNPEAWTLSMENPGVLGTSDQNYFFNPYRSNHIRASGDRSLASWQAFSGKDAHSRETWYTQPSGEPPRSHIFYNDTSSPTTIDLGSRQYLDLDQNSVLGSLTLQPYQSKILIDNGPAALSVFHVSPSLWAVDEAADFTLTVIGAGFTPVSVVRWNGSSRPTIFVSSTRLSVDILSSDVASAGEVPVSVFDPSPPPGGTQTPAIIFHIFASISREFLPVVSRH
jgi:hypothetical protein